MPQDHAALTRTGFSRLANAKSKRRRPLWLFALAAIASVVAVAWFSSFGDRLRGDATAGTAYGARVACSCRFVAGRSMDSCAADKLAGMEIVRFSADEQAKSVTASVPLVASATARLRPGYGCVLDRWENKRG